MEVFIYQKYAEMSQAAAKVVADIVNSKPNAVLGLATGSTPLGLYRCLGWMRKCSGRAVGWRT